MNSKSDNNSATVSQTDGDQSTSKPARGGPKKSSGKQSKQRRTDNFRFKVGQKQLNERRDEVMKRLYVFDDSAAELEKALQSLSINVQPVAVPLPVATRGVGFAVSVEYSRMCTTWTTDAIAAICTVFQYYRVALHLAYYKMYLARYEQGESVSFDVTSPFTFDEERRQVLGAITQVPISTHNILCSIGKIEGSSVWHSVPYTEEVVDGTQAALYLYPTNIRAAIRILADRTTDEDHRAQFHEMNPIPGARWINDPDDGWILENPDDIWPANYDSAMLQEDVHAYSNLLTRVSGRLPKSFLSNFVWSGRGSKGGLVSMDPATISLSADFLNVAAVQRRVTRRRDACGRQVEVVAPAQPAGHMYTGDRFLGRAKNVLTWSPDHDITSLEMTVGAASFVGEHVHQPTRLQINGKKQAHISPGTILYKLVDAPRPSST